MSVVVYLPCWYPWWCSVVTSGHQGTIYTSCSDVEGGACQALPPYLAKPRQAIGQPARVSSSDDVTPGVTKHLRIPITFNCASWVNLSIFQHSYTFKKSNTECSKQRVRISWGEQLRKRKKLLFHLKTVINNSTILNTFFKVFSFILSITHLTLNNFT